MDIVVDTLNICHFLYNKINEDNIVSTINRVTKWWTKNNNNTRVMFVLKDSTNTAMTEMFKKTLIETIKLNRCYLYLCELIKHEKVNDIHSSLGRDDFICAFLAKKYNCAVLTNDKLRDFSKLKQFVTPFLLSEISFATDRVISTLIKPTADAFKGKWLRKPKIISIHL